MVKIMERIIDLHLKFYQSLFREKKCITEALFNQGISVLTGFVDNVHVVRDFYESCYKNDNRRIVLCGINPGRLGAGKTGSLS
jgi:hypothetical protein